MTCPSSPLPFPLWFRGLRLLYSLLVELCVWLVLMPVHGLAAGSSSDSRWWERLGWGPLPPRSTVPRLLIHGVSVGEITAAEPLIDELLREVPTMEILLTTGTLAALQAAYTMQRCRPVVRVIGLLPWDRHWALRRWLEGLAPDLVVVMETELWPNLFTLCQELKIRLALANGRLYPQDMVGYRLLRPILTPVLACLDWAGVQDKRERARFLAIGAPSTRLHVVGNTKFDRAVHREPLAITRGAGLLIVAGSTHAPEERWLLRALQGLRRESSCVRLVLAPRRTGRAAGLGIDARRQGLCVAMESSVADAESWDVLILDRMGQLFSWYAQADLVFVGGSLVRRGGHNVLEPASLGRAILVGPYMDHFQAIAEQFTAADAWVQMANPGQLEHQLQCLLENQEKRHTLGRAAQQCYWAGQGSARRQATDLARLMNQSDLL